MGKIALLVSREDMLHQVHNILQEKDYEIGEMKVISTENAVSEARSSIAAGASIIIARGLQASLIKQYTDIPVVDIVITAQEMALLIIRAKQILKKQNPVIAVVGFSNMFCNMSYFDMIYEIDLRTYFAERGAQLQDVTLEAVKDQVDLVIGGDTAVAVAGQMNMPSLFLSITEDSLRNALEMAENMSYAMQVQKRNEAQMETLLDYSFHGMARLDAKGFLVDLNPIMEDMLEQKKATVLGMPAEDVFGELDRENLRQVLSEGNESYSLFMQIQKTSVFAIIAPIVIEGRVDGVVMTCHPMKKRQTTKTESRGFVAMGEFGDLLQYSKKMKSCIQLGKLCALSFKPVVIIGEVGTEKSLLAQSIHNASVRAGEPFVMISCDGIPEAQQMELLYGEKGAVVQARGGSLFLEDIEHLTPSNQYRLYQLIRYKVRIGNGVIQHPNADVRIMVAAKTPLKQQLDQGGFREDLYYLLEGLTIEIPPLRHRQEDLEIKIEHTIRECCQHYVRYHVLTEGGKKRLMQYPWQGNFIQVENFCERLILTAGKRNLDESAVERMWQELYEKEPSQSQDSNMALEVEPLPDEAIEITNALVRMAGNREKTADFLGISKATLWRKIKKYGLNQ